jgi:hypothetical protein
MSETLIHDVEKAHAMASAGDRHRTEAVRERRMAGVIKLAKLDYGEAPDENSRSQILSSVFTEVGVNNLFKRPDTVLSIVLNDDFSKEDIDSQRDKQIAGFFESDARHEARAQDLDDLAERKESWAELIYDNPAVEFYRAKYPELDFSDEWALERQVDQAQEYYKGHLKDMPRYREVVKEGKYVIGGLNQYLFWDRYDDESYEKSEPNPELTGLINNDDTTIAHLREFLLRQEELKLHAEKQYADDLIKIFADVKSRGLSNV